MRNVVFCGICWGLPIHGNLHLILSEYFIVVYSRFPDIAIHHDMS